MVLPSLAGDDRFEPRLFGGELVEVGIGLRIGGVHLVEQLLGLEHLAQALLDRFAHVLLRIEMGLLRQKADFQVGHRRRFAFDLAVDARHDPQQAGLA